MKHINILIVEDDESRKNLFAMKLGGGDYTVHCASTPIAAIEQVRGVQYDLIFLDHDLGPGLLCGRDVACCFYGSKNRYSTVIVHSHNFDGAKEICGILEDLGVRASAMPFSDDLIFWETVIEVLRKLSK